MCSAARATFVDTDDNATDFVVGAPTPAGTGGGVEEPPPPVGTPSRIHDVQGITRVSPLVGQVVTVPGVVTAVRTFGSARVFWLQDPQPGADAATSEGPVRVHRIRQPGRRAGRRGQRHRQVSEFRPGGAGSANQSTTQLTGPRAVVASSGNPLPAAEVLTPRTVPERYTPEANGGSIDALPLDPRRFALDFYESREGMRLGLVDAPVVGATDDFNGLFVTSNPRQYPTARRHAVRVLQRPERGPAQARVADPVRAAPVPAAQRG